MLLKQLHDQGPTLIQRSAQRREGNPVQVSQRNLCLWTCSDQKKAHQRTHPLRSASAFDVAAALIPALSKVKMSPSHLAALLGVLGSELQLDRRRVFLLGELGSSAVGSSSGRRRVKKESGE